MLSSNTLLQNRYLVVRQLGQGGMGAVYEATDQRFGRTVALKQAFYTQEALRRAFEREARLLNDLRHPALPVVIDYFAESNGWFLVMDYVPGEDLGTRMQRQGRSFSVDEVVRWADQVLDALEYLHGFEPPVIHRDIKPQNLKVTPKGDVKLLDFGLAKGTAAEAQGITSGTSVAGYTPHYAPIEQIQGAGTDVRSDLYALAATMYHLVTGRVPPDALERAMAQINGQPDPLRPVGELNASVPADVAEVMRRAMATSANQRPASATAMRRALRQASGLAGAPTVLATGPRREPATATPEAAAATAVAAPSTEPARSVDTAPEDAPTSVAPGARGSGARWLGAAALLVALAGGGAYAIRSYLGGEPRRGADIEAETTKTPPPVLRPLRFETLVVDAKGAVAERRRGEAQFFVEDLGGAPLDMVRVPGGSFEMGSPAPRAASAGAATLVRAAYVAPQEPMPAPRPYQRPGPRPLTRPRPYGEEPADAGNRKAKPAARGQTQPRRRPRRPTTRASARATPSPSPSSS